jgi:AraC family transcriptional regulator
MQMPEIKQFRAVRVASITEMGPFGQAIPRGFQKLFAWLGSHNLQPLGNSFGIFHDDPAKVPAEKLRSELCVPVVANVQSSGEIHVKEIAEFKAATITYQGEANIVPAYNQLYDWLHAQGYRDAGPLYEVYLSMPGEELRAEVFVPIAKVDLLAAPPKKPLLSAPKKVSAEKPVKRVTPPKAKKPAQKKPVQKQTGVRAKKK